MTFLEALLDFRRQTLTSRLSGPRRPGDAFGRITRRLLRSASYPCWLRAAEHPDRLPSCVRNPNWLGVLGTFESAFASSNHRLTRQSPVFTPPIASCEAP